VQVVVTVEKQYSSNVD